MSKQWRYGLGVDLVITCWAIAMAAIGTITLSGAARAGFAVLPSLIFLTEGALAFAVTLIGLRITITAMREARDDGDVRRGSAD